ncbi:MAG TPA: hypothetical protein VHV32_05450 [Candidatus Angelobacter sp.]|jgi:hypothetical protein|nr:hypothetical protein [Candidatus Angelobacter sp.]
MFSLPSLAQQNAAGQPVSIQKIPEDLRIPAILKVTLSSKRSKVGDLVKLEVAADVHDSSGAIVIPRHTRLTGRVTSVVRYEKKKQPAMLSFTVERAEWKDHSAALDAPVYGADLFATDSDRGEVVEGMRAATLGVEHSLNIVNTETQADTRVGYAGASGYAHAIRDSKFYTPIMQLKRVPGPAVRTAFVKENGDLQVPSELLVVLLNGVNAIE